MIKIFKPCDFHVHLREGDLAKKVLAENNEQSTNEKWELISVHAIPKGIDKLPMGPVTMMRNQLELLGGTKAYYSSEEWAESVRFWQQFAALDDSK